MAASAGWKCFLCFHYITNKIKVSLDNEPSSCLKAFRTLPVIKSKKKHYFATHSIISYIHPNLIYRILVHYTVYVNQHLIWYTCICKGSNLYTYYYLTNHSINIKWSRSCNQSFMQFSWFLYIKLNHEKLENWASIVMEKNNPQSDLHKENLSTIMIDDPCMKQIPVHVLCIFSNTMLYMYITSHMYI